MPENALQFNDILLYAAPSSSIKIEVIFEGETFRQAYESDFDRAIKQLKDKT